jgi:hypothetical protein
VPNFPRLRALALFGRRPVERAALSLLPASKNQHRSRPMHCRKIDPIGQNAGEATT